MIPTLPAWRDTPTRRAIIEFVERVTGGTADAIPAADRIAVFDNDGTLWTEKPMPTQLHFILDGWVREATADPTLAAAQPYKAAVSGDLAWLGQAIDRHYAGDDSDLKPVMAAILRSTAGKSVTAYAAEVAGFFANARHPTLGRPYAATVYRPMVELLRFLEEREFTCYIVSGGDRDFMRPITAEYYGIPPERVVGSAVALTWSDDDGGGDVVYGPSFSFLDDGPEKPVRIWSRVGRRPILAAGNSNGDVPMLSFATGGRDGLGLLIHHDDDTGRGDVPYESGADKALADAPSRGWTVVSVKDDWQTVFA